MPKKNITTLSNHPRSESPLHLEERFRIISELSSDFAYVGRVEADGTITPEWVNDALSRVTGYTLDEISSRGLKDIIYPDDWPLVREHIGKILSGQSDVIESRIVTKSGGLRWLRGSARPGWDGTQERVILIYGAAQDITERKRVEEALRESEERFKLATSGSPVTLYEQDLDLRYQWVYPQRPEFPEGNIGRSDEELLPPEDGNLLTQLKRQVIETGRRGRQEIPVTLPEGTHWYDTTVEPKRNAAGEVVGIAGLALDVTERKRLEREREEFLAREQAARRQAEEASQMKDEFLATVSHELRTPLNAILGWASILQMNLSDPEAAGKAAESIQRNARAQNQLIDDLLDISRIITGRMRLEVQPVDVPVVIQAAVNTIRPAVDAKEIRLQVVLDPAAGTVSGDPNRIQQIVWNLLTNAVKFTPKRGRVQVRLERINSHVEITVSDTGRGISPQFLPFVFDRFRQADSSFTRTQGGLGLGLSIVRQLVDLHGGTVEAESEGEGHGATFSVKLPVIISKRISRYTGPLEPKEMPGRSNHPTQLPSLANLKLLVVEDEADARELLITLLKECGAEVQTVATARDGLVRLEEWKPDVLISDISMPYEDGFSLIGKVRALPKEEGGQVPAIALTAHVRDEDRLQALASGFDAHVGKPMEPLELVTVIANLARRTQSGSRDA